MDAKPGDIVKVATKDETYEGVLMPRSELADEDHIVVKLASGYNIGVSKKNIKKLEKKAAGKREAAFKGMKFSKAKPPISMVSVGGTITAKVDYKTGGVYPFETPEELLQSVPELADFVSIKKMSQPFSLLSEDMSSDDWGKIATEVKKELDAGAEGVIVTHGTDTLHYTAAALSFMLPNLPKPVAVVGAQRSVDRGSFDGNQNILCAAHHCTSDIAEVAIVMHGTTEDKYCLACRGTKVRKMHSSRRDAFRPVNTAPLAKIFPDGNIIVSNYDHARRSGGKATLDTAFEEKVALVKYYPGADPGVLDYYAGKGFRGIILEGTGFGHTATQPLNKKFNWLEPVKKLIDKGIFVGMTTQTLYGRTDPLVYSAGRLLKDAGVVYLGDMLPETAYVKLGWVLGHKKWDVKAKMLENIAGELNPRIDPESFLY